MPSAEPAASGEFAGPVPESLLHLNPDRDSVLDFDQWERYSTVARLVERLCTGCRERVRILEGRLQRAQFAAGVSGFAHPRHTL